LRPEALVCYLPDVFAGVLAGDVTGATDFFVVDLPMLLFSVLVTLVGRSIFCTDFATLTGRSIF
jgi:hypothetical protein